MGEIRACIEVFSKNYSRFRQDSLFTKIAHAPGDYLMPDDFEKIFLLYRDLYKLTGGAFTPLVGKLMEEAGYDASYSLKPATLHALPRLDDVLFYNPPSLKVKKPVTLDIGAAGKGYLIDIVAIIIKSHDVRSFCIDAGGDILYEDESSNPIRVGLENPVNLKQVVGVANILNQSICASAANRRTWRDYHHIINPLTLKPTSDIIATWVVADTALLADALATCLFFAEAKVFMEKYKFEYVLVRHDLSWEVSPNFNGEIFYNK